MSEMHIGEALKLFLSKSKLKNGVHAVQIKSIWENLMGRTIAKHTDKIEIVNGTLFIQTSIGTLKHELTYQKEKIIERINEAMGEKVITQVVVR